MGAQFWPGVTQFWPTRGSYSALTRSNRDLILSNLGTNFGHVEAKFWPNEDSILGYVEARFRPNRGPHLANKGHNFSQIVALFQPSIKMCVQLFIETHCSSKSDEKRRSCVVYKPKFHKISPFTPPRTP